MLKVNQEARKLIKYLSNIPERGLTEEEKERLEIDYKYFKQIVAHEFKWGYAEDAREVLRKCIEIDDLYFNHFKGGN